MYKILSNVRPRSLIRSGGLWGSCSSLSSEGAKSPVMKFLKKKGYSDEVASGMLRAIPNASVAGLKQMGDSGLRALSGAVAREVAQRAAKSALDTVSIKIIPFKRQDTEGIHLQAYEGDTLFDVWSEHNEILGPFIECACQGIAACSTCHVILNEEDYSRLPEKPDEAEMDMLDLAEGLTPTSRLGCQLKFTKAQDGLVLRLPESVNNLW